MIGFVFLPFSTLNIFQLSPGLKVSAEKLSYRLTELTLNEIGFSSLAALKLFVFLFLTVLLKCVSVKSSLG